MLITLSKTPILFSSAIQDSGSTSSDESNEFQRSRLFFEGRVLCFWSISVSCLIVAPIGASVLCLISTHHWKLQYGGTLAAPGAHSLYAGIRQYKAMLGVRAIFLVHHPNQTDRLSSDPVNI
jgi:hypothetical protein